MIVSTHKLLKTILVRFESGDPCVLEDNELKDLPNLMV